MIKAQVTKLRHAFYSRLMKTWGKLAIALVVALSTVAAQAHDADFHFNVTYMAAREIGINHDVAVKLALHAVLTDESMASGPFFSSKIREIFHFNGPDLESNFKGEGVQGKLAKVMDTFKVKMFSLSQPDSPVPYALFAEALKKGDLAAAAGHLHSIEDLDPHSVFIGRLGHPFHYHHPDRPWMHQDQFRASLRKTFQALYTIRQMLPPEALDFDHANNFAPEGKKSPEDLNNPDLLAQRFMDSPEIKGYYQTDFLRHPDYVAHATAEFLKKFKAEGIVSQDIDFAQLLPPGVKIDGTLDFYELVTKVIANGELLKDNKGNPLFNLEKLVAKKFPEFRDFDHVQTYYYDEALRQLTAQYHDANVSISDEELQTTALQIAKEEIAQRIVQMARGFVPKPLDEKNQVEASESPELYAREMELRHGALNEISFKFYGHRIGFDFKHTRKFTAKMVEKYGRFLPNSVAGWMTSTHHVIVSAGVEIYTLPSRARWAWVLHVWKAVYLRSIDFLKSPEFLRGAKDIVDPTLVKQMLSSGVLKTLTTEDLKSLTDLSPSRLDRFSNAIHDFFKNRFASNSESLGKASDESQIIQRSGALTCHELFLGK